MKFEELPAILLTFIITNLDMILIFHQEISNTITNPFFTVKGFTSIAQELQYEIKASLSFDPLLQE